MCLKTHTESGNTFFILLLNLSTQTCLLFFFLTCRHVLWRWHSTLALQDNWMLWSGPLLSQVSQSVSGSQSSHLPLFLTRKLSGTCSFCWALCFGKKGWKERLTSALHNCNLGHMSLMVNMFNLLGVLYLPWFVTLFWSNVFHSEKICLERSKTPMLSGTHCVSSGYSSHHFPWYIVPLPTEWGEKLNSNDKCEACLAGTKLFSPLCAQFSTRRDCCLENNFRKNRK